MDARRGFDGVICFGGGDWWYHNRGHYDMQLMQQLKEHVPVLFVNSIGIRVPKIGEGRMFLTRVTRKIRSIRQGFQKVDERWGVLSPVALPGHRFRTVNRITLPAQVRRSAHKMGMTRPLAWVTCPPIADYVDKLGAAGVVYQRTDRWEEFPQADANEIRRCDHLLKSRADITLFCAKLLLDEEGEGCREPFYLDHGVDYEQFASAGTSTTPEPIEAELAGLPSPRIGFVGGIDSHTFDANLFLSVAKSMPDVGFYLVGACSLSSDWCSLPNVRQLGQRPYEEVPAYMAAADVLIMPWNKNDWIHACNPVKLKEYLAVGRPVVTRDFYELQRYAGFVTIADSPQDFAAGIRSALTSPIEPTHLRSRVRDETWDVKAGNLIKRLDAAGLSMITTKATSHGSKKDQGSPQ